MATSTTIPVTVSPEARARVEELGLQDAFDQMLERALQVFADLKRVRVELVEQTDEIDDPLVVLWVHRLNPSPDGSDAVDDEYTKWYVQTFGPEVIANMIMSSIYEAGDAA